MFYAALDSTAVCRYVCSFVLHHFCLHVLQPPVVFLFCRLRLAISPRRSRWSSCEFQHQSPPLEYGQLLCSYSGVDCLLFGKGSAPLDARISRLLSLVVIQSFAGAEDTELVGEIRQGLAMCIFSAVHAFTIIPRYAALRLRGRRHEFFIVRLLLCGCLVNPPSRKLLAQFFLVFSASEDKQRVHRVLSGFIHRLVKVLEHTWCSTLCSPSLSGNMQTTGVKVESPFKGEHQRYCAVRSGRECCRWQSHAGRELPQQE